MPLSFRHDVALAPLTTIELGGPARHLVQANNESDVAEALRWASGRGVPAFVMGGGSNLIVGDAGFPGLVLRMGETGLTFTTESDCVIVEARAGQPWDDVVAQAVARNLAGLECLSGIPGLAGATPIQNVGAYGHEIAETLRSVRVLDRGTLQITNLTPEACQLSYRDSLFKRHAERFVVLAVTFALRPDGAPAVRYRELQDALAGFVAPTVSQVRQTVLALRRRKSMVIDASDPNRRSVGSFFTNPIVSSAEADRVTAQALAEGVASSTTDVPQFPAGNGRIKLAAGWLIERAGLPRGFTRGAVGLSSRHALALVHHGGGSTADLLSLARHVRTVVHDRFGITLVPEPVLLGATL